MSQSLLSAEEIRFQSLSVWKSRGKTWVENALENAKLERKDARELEHSGIGKFMLLVGFGPSLENKIETIKAYRDRVDIICCDKAFGPLLEKGIKADFVFTADADIPFKWIEPHIKKTEGVGLLCTPYANPVWTKCWRGPKYFYVNQDAIGTEETFLKIMGNQVRVIPASSNVSNAMLVFWMDCSEKRNSNWGGYEKYFLVGYDYSWPAKGNYYAWEYPVPKAHYMNHRTMLDRWRNIVFSSENLVFSCKWLTTYIETFRLPVVNCSGQGLLEINRIGELKQELEKINSDHRSGEFVKDSFRVWKNSYKAYQESEDHFHRMKEELVYGCR